MITRLRRRLAPEPGFSLVEMTVSLFVISIAAVVFLSVLTSSVAATGAATRENNAVNELRTISAAMDRELRSAACIETPALVSPATSASDFGLEIETRAGGTAQWVRYVVGADGVLTKRTAVTQGALSAAAPVTVAEHVTYSAAAKPFTVYAPAPLARVTLDLRVRSGSGDDERRVLTTITGRGLLETGC